MDLAQAQATVEDPVVSPNRLIDEFLAIIEQNLEPCLPNANDETMEIKPAGVEIQAQTMPESNPRRDSLMGGRAIAAGPAGVSPEDLYNRSTGAVTHGTTDLMAYKPNPAGSLPGPESDEAPSNARRRVLLPAEHNFDEHKVGSLGGAMCRSQPVDLQRLQEPPRKTTKRISSKIADAIPDSIPQICPSPSPPQDPRLERHTMQSITGTMGDAADPHFNPERIRMLKSADDTDYTPWFMEAEQKSYMPTGANAMSMNDQSIKPKVSCSATKGLDDVRPGQPSQAIAPPSMAPSQGRRKMRGTKRKAHSDDSTGETPLSKLSVLRTLDPHLINYQGHAIRNKHLDKVCAALRERVVAYEQLCHVPGHNLPALILRGRSPDGSLLDFDSRVSAPGSNVIRARLTNVISNDSLSVQQRRAACEALLRCVVRWNPGLFPELTSTISTTRIVLNYGPPEPYVTALG